MGEMETGIPTEAVITEMGASKEFVIIYFEVPSKEVAAKTVQAFRSFTSVESISVDAFESQEATEEGGASTYHFALTCYYPGSQVTDAEGGNPEATEEQTTEEGTEEDAQ